MNEAGGRLLDQAIREYVATQELNSDRSENLMNLGNLYVSLDDPSRAERYFRAALAREPGFAPAWANLAELYRAQGMNDKALKTLQSGLQNAPESGALHHSLGLALVRAGQRDEELEELSRAVKLAPENARYAYVYGIALHSAGQSETAVAVLQSAHQRHANDQEILFALATINRDRGNLAKARKWAAELLGLDPSNGQARALLD
jgi:Flp pilus assembly protein TadD